MYDCIIIGGGPAGLTAATYLGRFLRSTLVIDEGAGRAAQIPQTHNLLGFPDGISGRELLDRMREHASRYGAEMVTGVVEGIARTEAGFAARTSSRTFEARTILLAQGVSNHRPRIAQDAHDRGVAHGLIRYCPICDAYEVRGKRVAVLGCSDNGAAEARFIRHYTGAVTLLAQNAAQLSEIEALHLSEIGVSVRSAPVQEIAVEDRDLRITLADGESLQFDTLYAALGTSANCGLARMAGAELSASGCILVDEHQQTTISGIFAAGDMVEGLDQIAVASGQAAKAATAIHNRLAD